MDPLSVLLAFLAGAALADDARAKKINYKRDDLHRKLGIHGTLPPIGPSIDSRLRWITRTYGPEIGWLARRAAILWGHPWYSHRSYADIGPLLPWLAWRWSKGDATELRRVLTEEATEWIPGLLQFHSNPATKKAYATLHHLTDWLARARPDLTQMIWGEAIAKEWAWSKTRIAREYTLKNLNPELAEIGPGELVLRFPLEDAERAPWILTKVSPLSDRAKIILGTHLASGGYRAHYERTIPDSSRELYILWDADKDPVALVFVDDKGQLLRISGAHGETVFDWDKDIGSTLEGEEIVDHLKIAARHIQPDLQKWRGRGAILLAFLDLSEDEAISMLHELPELLNRDAGVTHILMDKANEWYGPRFIQAWADAVNADYSQEGYEHSNTEIAVHQRPSLALVQWIEAGDLDDPLDERLAKEPADLQDLPGIFEILEPGEGEIEYDDSEGLQAPIWTIRLHDLLEHPDGARLDIRIEILVVYSPRGDDRSWRVLTNDVARFHSGAPGSDWQTTWDAWVPIFPVLKKRGSYILNPELIHDPRDYGEARGWWVSAPHRSLDVALRRAWNRLDRLLKLEEMPSEEWKRFFPEGLDLLDPPDPIRVADLRAWKMAAPEHQQ